MNRVSGKAKHHWGGNRLQIAGVVGVLILLVVALFIQRSETHASVASGSVLATFLENNGRTSFNAGETIINPNTAPKLKLHWKYKAGGAIVTQPVEAKGMLYWGSWDGVEHATNLNGGQVWAINLGKTVSCGKAGVSSTATVASVLVNGNLTLTAVFRARVLTDNFEIGNLNGLPWTSSGNSMPSRRIAAASESRARESARSVVNSRNARPPLALRTGSAAATTASVCSMLLGCGKSRGRYKSA